MLPVQRPPRLRSTTLLLNSGADFRSIRNLRFRIQKVLQPFSRGLSRLKSRETLGHLLDRNVEETCVLHEGNQIAKRETLTSRQQAAAPHGQTHARCAQSHNDGKIEGGMQGVVKRMMKHFIGEALKLPQVLVLTNESFRCPNTHNSFIEARRNLGIRLTDEPLRANQLLLKDCRPHRQGRDNAQDHQR